MIQTRNVRYGPAELSLEGLLAYDDATASKRPVVLISPTIRGRTDFEEEKARELAGMGYAALAIDLYGGGKKVRPPEEARALMDVLNSDRKLLLQRMELALAAASHLPEADSKRLAAIGFCFGGKCVLDLARNGADLAAVASFHGLYDAPGINNETPVKARVLVLHGWDDPLAPPETVVALGQELTRKQARWELVAFGHTGHAFTNPMADGTTKGLRYNPEASALAWERMLAFLKSAFTPE